MEQEVRTHLRIPIAPLADALRSRFGLSEPLSNVRLDADAIVFEFRRQATSNGEELAEVPVMKESIILDASTRVRSESAPLPQRQRRQARRNRMRTRGWPVVAKIATSRGQTAVIYEPLVKALENRPLSPTEQRAIVGRLLRENGNDPNEASIEYYLLSTLEYLDQKKKNKRDNR